jgi:hypothetical protein
MDGKMMMGVRRNSVDVDDPDDVIDNESDLASPDRSFYIIISWRSLEFKIILTLSQLKINRV